MLFQDAGSEDQWLLNGFIILTCSLLGFILVFSITK